MTDDVFAYTRTVAFGQALADPGVKHMQIRRRRPERNGTSDRVTRTMLEERVHVRIHRPDHVRFESSTGSSAPAIAIGPTHRSPVGRL